MIRSSSYSSRRRIAGAAALLAIVVVALAAAMPLVIAIASQVIPPVATLTGRIVYTRAASNPTNFAIDIFIADGNGENERQLTNTVDASVYGSARGEDQPRWSPDGSEVAFSTANKDGLVSVWRVSAAGGTPTPVVTNDGEGGDPSWRPDGRCIAYSGAHVGGASTLDLKLACLDGTVTTLLATSDVDERGPDVSPDGRRIVYQARRPPKSYTDRTEWSLRLVDADGTGDQLLYAPPVGSAMYPRWSPDMTQIAFVAGRLEGIGTLTVLNVATRQTSALATLAAGPLAWSGDGTYIMFYNTDASGPRTLAGVRAGDDEVSQASQLLGVYVLREADRQLSRLLGAAGGAAAKADSYQWGYAPDWWAPSPTPTPSPTATSTATLVPTETPTPTVTPTSTPVAPRVNYLPLVSKSAALGDR